MDIYEEFGIQNHQCLVSIVRVPKKIKMWDVGELYVAWGFYFDTSLIVHNNLNSICSNKTMVTKKIMVKKSPLILISYYMNLVEFKLKILGWMNFFKVHSTCTLENPYILNAICLQQWMGNRVQRPHVE